MSMWKQSPPQKNRVVAFSEFLKCVCSRGAAKGPLFFFHYDVFGQRELAGKGVKTSNECCTMFINIQKVTITIFFSAKTLKNK